MPKATFSTVLAILLVVPTTFAYGVLDSASDPAPAGNAADGAARQAVYPWYGQRPVDQAFEDRHYRVHFGANAWTLYLDEDDDREPDAGEVVAVVPTRPARAHGNATDHVLLTGPTTAKLCVDRAAEGATDAAKGLRCGGDVDQDGKQDVPPLGAFITGRVMDGDSRADVGALAATVYAAPRETLCGATDEVAAAPGASGHFTIRVPCQGTYDVRVVASAYAPAAPRTALAMASPDAAFPLAFELDRLRAPARVTVLSLPDAATVGGLEVRLAGQDTTFAASSTTGADGVASFAAVPWGLHFATPVSADAMLTAPALLVMTPTQSVHATTAFVAPQPTLAPLVVTGRADDADRRGGDPQGAIGVVVRATRTAPCGDGRSEFFSVSRVTGDFAIPVSCPGTYTITANPAGETATRLYEVGRSTTAEVSEGDSDVGTMELARGRGNLDVRVVMVTPPERVWIRSLMVDASSREAAVMTTPSPDAVKRVARFDDLAWDIYVAQASGQSLETTVGFVVPGQRTVTVLTGR